MGQSKPSSQSAKERTSNFREVSLGFPKKISADEARRCPQCAQPTCMPVCPLGVDIPGFIRFLRESDAVSALERIKKDNPFPSICGRICSAPCEPACVFSEDHSAISIRALERYAADNGYKPSAKSRTVIQFNGKKVAIIGSGPSAMMAAHQLLQKKIKVEIFEAADQLGGLLRYGIPEFRLPKEIIDEEYAQLQAMGLGIHTNVFIGQTKSLSSLVESFDAVLIATGAGLAEFSQIQGENLGGVYYAQEILLRVQLLGKSPLFNDVGGLFRGDQTVVVGGGYSALDAARMAVRLGQKVDLVFDGLEEQMGVSSDMLKEAVEEGVNVHAPFKVLNIEGDDKNCVSGLEAQQLELVENNGKLSLLPIQGESGVFAAQTLIIAKGSRTNTFLAKNEMQLKLNNGRSFWVESSSFKTSLDKVYAVGGALNASIKIVEAFAQGKAVAQEIVKNLNL